MPKDFKRPKPFYSFQEWFVPVIKSFIARGKQVVKRDYSML